MATNNTNTQIERIKQARRAYILKLTTGHRTKDRYQIYLDSGRGLEALWPSDCSEGGNARLLPYQVYHTKGKHNFPAYHFAIVDSPHWKPYELSNMLKKINETIVVSFLDGTFPDQLN